MFRIAPFCALALAGLLAAAGTGAEERSEPFAEAEIFVELNDTDGDLGVHASIDGEPWTTLEVEGPRERELLEISAAGRLRQQGLTQLFFESAEPTFDELTPEQFFRRFPEGWYEIEARRTEGGALESRAWLSHVLAAPPGNVTVNAVAAAESCDAVPLPKVHAPVLIAWDAVTESHPDIGRRGPVEIALYQFFVEREGVKLAVDLPPAVTRFEVPSGVTDLGTSFKFEIIARTSTGNNTAVESCFEVW